MAVVRRSTVALVLAVVLLVAALVVGAWEIRRLDHQVHALRLGGISSARTDRALRSLSTQISKVRESTLRQEFQLSVQSDVTQLVLAVESGKASCIKAKQSWQSYVNDKLIPYLNKPANRDLKVALRHYDPDYHATLLNDFVLTC